jgi:hypothetical protein
MRRILLVIAAAAIAGSPAMAADEPQLAVSARVDKTAVDAGTPVTLTISLSGDVSGASVPPLAFPEGFAVAAQTQGTNVAVRGSVMERSTRLVFVLIPSRPGTFQLGPFAVEQRGRTLKTEPIEITVKKAVLPPTLKEDGERFTL